MAKVIVSPSLGLGAMLALAAAKDKDVEELTVLRAQYMALQDHFEELEDDLTGDDDEDDSIHAEIKSVGTRQRDIYNRMLHTVYPKVLRLRRDLYTDLEAMGGEKAPRARALVEKIADIDLLLSRDPFHDAQFKRVTVR